MLLRSVGISSLQTVTFRMLSAVTVMAFCVETNSALHSEFVTLRRIFAKWTTDGDELPAASISSPRRERGVETSDDIWNSEERYQLRFKPTEQHRKLFWHKFPKPQQVDPESGTQAPDDIPTPPPPSPPTEEPPADTSSESSAPMGTTVEPSTVEPVTTSTTKTTTTAAPPASTTSTTIMRPHHQRPRPPKPGSTLQKLLPLFGSPLEANLIEKQQAAPRPPAPSSKSKGFLSLFEVINFENNKCSVAMGDIRTLEGVCYHEFECRSLGGIPTQRCAEGVGVCCVFLTGCGETTEQPIVYFESPNYPSAVRERLICVLVVHLRVNVQQLRLDFLMFELNRPTNGDCLDDQFIVSGQDINFVVPVLCGINTGQHIYIDVGNSLHRQIYLSIFVKVPTGARSFNIQITQLETNLAPNGCLQYFREAEGIVKSFNYDSDGTVVDNPEATYLNNLNYAICMMRAKDVCTVTYTTEMISGDQLDFQLVNKDEDETDLVPDGQAGAGIFNCPDDFIAVNQVRLCGERLNDGSEQNDFSMHAPVKDIAAGPIILPVRSDGEYVGRGFRLRYKQELCLQMHSD